MNRRPSKYVVPMDGKQFGHLTVLRREGSEVRGRKKKYASWRCKCTCGQEVVVRGQNLRRGARKSCAVNGHFWDGREQHGATTTHPSEYSSWRKMWERCTSPKQHNYKNYGGRGITVSDRWKSFKMFLQDMGAKPDPSFTIERKDTNGNYEPGNCRWATRTEQYRNTTRSVFVTYQGKKQLLYEVAKSLGLSTPVVYGRLKGGWSLESALSVPVRRKAKTPSCKP
jgi:hypothetical protein